MNNISKLIKLDFSLNENKFLYMALISLGLISYAPPNSIMIINYVIYIAGIFYTYQVFNKGNWTQPDNFMLLPCSNNEKFASKYISSTLIFSVIMLCCILAGTFVHSLFFKFSFVKSFYNAYFTFDSQQYVTNPLTYWPNITQQFFSYICFVNPAIILGMTYFTKNKVAKSIIVMMIVSSFIGLVGQKINFLLFGTDIIYSANNTVTFPETLYFVNNTLSLIFGLAFILISYKNLTKGN